MGSEGGCYAFCPHLPIQLVFFSGSLLKWKTTVHDFKKSISAMCAFIPTVTLTLQLTFKSILSSAPTPFLFLLPLLPHLGTPSVKLNSFRSHYALGRDGMRSTRKVLGHLFVCSLICLYCSLICLLCTICFDQALHCARLLTHSLTRYGVHGHTLGYTNLFPGRIAYIFYYIYVQKPM